MNRFAIIEITEKCNLNCSHCYIGDKGIKTLSQTDIDFIVNNLKEIECERVIISGGEPLLFPELIEYTVNKCKYMNISTSIVSNGLLLDRLHDDIFDNILGIQISVDGLKETHDKIRGKGTFEKTINNIEKAIEKGWRDKISVQMTISSINWKEFYHVYEMLEKLKIKMSVERVSTVGNASNYQEFDMKEYNKILDFMVEKGILTSDPLLNVRKCISLGLPIELLNNMGLGCSAGRNGLAITVDMDVLPCVRIRKPCGNLKNTRLVEIINSNKYTKYSEPCNGCEKCNYKEICGGCKADSKINCCVVE